MVNALRQEELKHVNDSILARDEERQQPLNGGHVTPAMDMGVKTLGEMFVETKQYREAYLKNKQIGLPATIDMSLKTLFQRTAGFAPESVRSGLIVPKVDFSLAEVLDLIPIFPISQAAYKYMEETTRTHGAAEKAEGVAYAESEFVFTERSSDVQKITDSIPVTDEQLEDEGSVASLLDQRLRYGIKKRLASQLLNGTGVAPNLRGILNVVGIQTQAKGADPTMAAAYKAITKVRFTGQAEPGAFIFHPNDWQDVVLTQDANGNFLFGHPALVSVNSLWGLRVALSTGIAENTGLVGDYTNFSRLDEKRGVDVQVGYVNAQFTEGKKTLRADTRVAFTATRPAAFCTITGI
jgi:HK97 family phage major capsid protein